MNYALITGASSGLGWEFSLQLAAKKRNLVLVARSAKVLHDLAEHLAQLHQITVKVIVKDLSQPGAVAEIIQELAQDQIQIDILINNAGLGDLQLFANQDPLKISQMLMVNIQALTELSRACLPPMIQSNRGYILNVASTAAYQPGPNMAVYFASKAYVESLTLALRAETSSSKVHISCLCPGPTSTNFGKVAGAKVVDHLSKTSLSPKEVVAQGLEGLIQNRALIIPGKLNQIGVFLARHLPRPLVLKVTAWLFSSKVKSR